MIYRCHRSGACVTVIAVICAIAVAMAGIAQTAWAMDGCTGACCEPPQNAMHHPGPTAVSTPHCGGAPATPCGLEDTPVVDLSHLTAAMPHAGRLGSAVIQYQSALKTAVQRRSLSAQLAFAADTHISAPPLYLSIAVLLL